MQEVVAQESASMCFFLPVPISLLTRQDPSYPPLLPKSKDLLICFLREEEQEKFPVAEIGASPCPATGA